MELEVVAAVVVAIVVKSDAVELLKGINNFAHRCGKTRIQRDASCFRSTDIHTLAFLDVPKVRRLYSASLVWYDGRLRMPQQRPLRWPEKGMCLDIRSASPGAETAKLVLDEQFPDK